MKRHAPAIMLAAYVFIAIITFGHHVSRGSNVTTGPRNDLIVKTMDVKVIEGFLLAMAWPLYWSWQAFEVTK